MIGQQRYAKGPDRRSGLFFLTARFGRFRLRSFPQKMSFMVERVTVHGLQVARVLHDFVMQEVLPGTGVVPDKFWQGFSDLAVKLMPENRALLAERDRLQAAIDDWHKAHPERPIDQASYTTFLREIGYLVP